MPIFTGHVAVADLHRASLFLIPHSMMSAHPSILGRAYPIGLSTELD